MRGGPIKAVLVVAVVGVVLGAGCAATLPPCPARGGPAWRQYSTAHFDLRSDLDPEDAETVVRAMEDTRATMLALFWKGGPEPTHRTQVIVLASRSALEVFLGSSVAGMYVRPPPFLPSILFAGSDFLTTPVFRHELAHDLGRWFLPVQPDWFWEGVAGLLETVRYDPERKRGFGGEVSVRSLQIVRRYGVLDVQRLLAMVTPDDGLELARFEASSWLLVHYLANHRQDSFVRFQRRLTVLEPARQAWQAEFSDLDLDALTGTLTNYAWSGSFMVAEVSLELWQWDVKVRSLSDAEVHGVRAYLFSMFPHPGRGLDLAAVGAELGEALHADSPPIDALAVAFYRPPGPRGRQERVALAQRAVQVHPDSWLSWLMVADSTDAADPAHGSALVRALARAPDNRDVLGRLAILKAEEGRWSDVLLFSGKAIRANSQGLTVFLAHFRALAETGRCAEAARWVSALSEVVRVAESAKLSRAWKDLQQKCEQVRPDGAATQRMSESMAWR